MNVLDKLLSERLQLKSCHIDRFKELMSVKKLGNKDLLIREGTVCDFLGVVVSGWLRSYVQNEETEHNNDFFFENDFVSAYASFLTRQPNVCNIQALTDTEICCISYRQLNDLVKEDAEWMKLGKYVSDHFFIKKCNRETSFLKESASERFQSCLKHYPGIEQKVSQYNIASYLGIKPETLSRIKRSAYIYKL